MEEPWLPPLCNFRQGAQTLKWHRSRVGGCHGALTLVRLCEVWVVSELSQETPAGVGELVGGQPAPCILCDKMIEKCNGGERLSDLRLSVWCLV